MEERAPNVVDWIRRINATEQPEGAFLPIDEVPETLYPMLEDIFTEQFPILLDTVNRVEEWLDEHPDREYVSRAIGEHEFTVGEVSDKRLVFPYSQWMLQRPLDYYQQLDTGKKENVDALLEQVRGLDAMQTRINRRLERRNNRIAPVKA